MPGVGIPGQGKKPGKAKGTRYVSSLETKGGHIAGGTRTVTAMGGVWDAHAGKQNLYTLVVGQVT